MQQVVVGEIGGLQLAGPFEQGRRGHRKDHRIGELHGIDVVPVAGAIANTYISFTRAEVGELVRRVDGQLDVGVQLVETSKAWNKPA